MMLIDSCWFMVAGRIVMRWLRCKLQRRYGQKVCCYHKTVQACNRFLFSSWMVSFHSLDRSRNSYHLIQELHQYLSSIIGRNNWKHRERILTGFIWYAKKISITKYLFNGRGFWSSYICLDAESVLISLLYYVHLDSASLLLIWLLTSFPGQIIWVARQGRETVESVG